MYSRRSIIESGLLGIPRSTLGYELRMPAKDRPVIDAMKLLSSQYSRGYRGIRIFLKRQGHQLGWHRAHRLWRQAGLQLPRRRPKRSIAGGRPRSLWQRIKLRAPTSNTASVPLRVQGVSQHFIAS